MCDNTIEKNEKLCEDDFFELQYFGFIIDISNRALLKKTKKSLLLGLGQMEIDDRFFTYNSDDIVIPRRRGEMASQISKASHYAKLPVQQAIKDVVAALSQEDLEPVKYILFLSDRKEDDVLEYQVQMGVNSDAFYNDDCFFVFCTLGLENNCIRNVCDKSPRCRYIELDDVNEFTTLIPNIYKNGLEAVRCQLDMESIKKDYDRIR